MPTLLDRSELLSRLKTAGAAAGLDLHEERDGGLAGTNEAILAKWFLGGRKVSYRMSCRLAEAEHTVHFREVVAEKSWGIPPPTLSVETTTVSGWTRSGTRTDHAVGGGGTIDYAKVRDAVAAATADAGWRFHLEGGRMP